MDSYFVSLNLCNELCRPTLSISSRSHFTSTSFSGQKPHVKMPLHFNSKSHLFPYFTTKKIPHAFNIKARAPRGTSREGKKFARRMAVAIPLRAIQEEYTIGSIEVLMVTDRSGKGYVFPKGGVETFDGSFKKAATREAMEEAGVLGGLTIKLQSTEYISNRVKRKGYWKGRCFAKVFVLEVETELDSWPEMERRQRDWCTLEDAKERCKYDWMRDALIVLETRLHEFTIGSDVKPLVELTRVGNQFNPQPLTELDMAYIMAQ